MQGDLNNLLARLISKQSIPRLLHMTPWGHIPTAYSARMPMLTAWQVTKQLIDYRKPKSRVVGNIFRSLIAEGAASLAISLTDVYNAILNSTRWPGIWKTEYVSVIPKTSHPEGING